MPAAIETRIRWATTATLSGENRAAEIEEIEGPDASERPGSQMDGEQGFKCLRAPGKTCQHAPLQRAVFESQHQRGHSSRPAHQGSMELFIDSEVAALNGCAERLRLLQPQADT